MNAPPLEQYLNILGDRSHYNNASMTKFPELITTYLQTVINISTTV